MKTAFILAAGFGTRLKELTQNKPKALVEFNGKPLLQICIEKLISQNFTKIIVNVHHFAEQIIDFLKKNDFNAEIIISHEKEEILDTGGAILFAKKFLQNEDNFLLHNADVITNMNFDEILRFHTENKNMATLAIRDRKSNRKLVFDENFKLLERTVENQNFKNIFAFSGISVINTEIFDFIDEKGKFSIIDLFLRLTTNHRIIGFLHNDDYWKDMGKIEDFNVF
jgi:NDP-sugar pyrophosphorylase family protein